MEKKLICAVSVILVCSVLCATEIGEKVYMEIKIDGDNVGKWVTLYVVEEYDLHGWLIYEKDHNGETRYERDKYGAVTHKKSLDSRETCYEHKYDKNNRAIHRKDNAGSEEWYEYDKNGNMVCKKCSDDLEEWYECDKNGNLVYTKLSNGLEFWREYDKVDNMILDRSNIGNIWLRKNEYHEDCKTLKNL